MVASSRKVVSVSPQQYYDGDPLVVSCSQCDRRAANICDQVGKRLASGGCSDSCMAFDSFMKKAFLSQNVTDPSMLSNGVQYLSLFTFLETL